MFCIIMVVINEVGGGEGVSEGGSGGVDVVVKYFIFNFIIMYLFICVKYFWSV